MSEPHRIRLRGPWDYEPLAEFVDAADGTVNERVDDLPPAGRAAMPRDWREMLGGDFRGRVRFCRRFSCPTGLEPGDRVELVIDAVAGSAAVFLDDQPLGDVDPSAGSLRSDVSGRLSGRHELVVEVQSPATCVKDQPRGLTGEVRLEIFPAG